MSLSTPSVAKERWQILKKGLLKKENREVDGGLQYSVRRHNTFSLFSIKKIPHLIAIEETNNYMWYEYSFSEDSGQNIKPVVVRKSLEKVSTEDLVSLDNTGNVCVWASEEIMAFYCVVNKSEFENKTICELGGGSTNLAALLLAKNLKTSKVILSDGNEKALANLRKIVAGNYDLCETADKATVQCIRWDDETTFRNLNEMCDTVLCADCLFFDQFRESLAHTLFKILKSNGKAYIFAPKRGKTFNEFFNIASRLFGSDSVKVLYNYNDIVWKKHEMMLESSTYDEDIHYPLLLTIEKA